MEEKIKFLHIANHIHTNLFQQPYLIGGFYNWCKVFDSQIYYYSQFIGRYKEFDIIFIDIAKPEIEAALVTKVREELGPNSSTIIVTSVDYSIELWKDIFNLHHLRNELLQSDFIFAAEPYMAKCLNELLEYKKDINLLQHPTNVDVYKKLRVPLNQKENILMAIIHRYDNNWVTPWLATKNISNIYKVAILLDAGQEMFVLPYFHNVQTGREFSNWIQNMRLAKFCIDSYSNVHSYGRVPVDCGIFQIPCVASNICYSQNQVWPDLVTEPWDVKTQAQLLQRLINDEAFYMECIVKADKNVDQFNYSNSRIKFMDMVNGHGEKIK